MINYLDSIFDLSKGKYMPYTKELYNHKHNSNESNHPPGFLNSLHKSV